MDLKGVYFYMVLTSMCPEFVLIDGLLTMERVVLELFFLLCSVIFRGVDVVSWHLWLMYEEVV